MLRINRLTTLAVLSATLLSSLALMPGKARASEEGRKNAAALLGGLTVYEAVKGHAGAALLAGAATAIALDQIDNDRDHRYSDRYDRKGDRRDRDRYDRDHKVWDRRDRDWDRHDGDHDRR